MNSIKSIAKLRNADDIVEDQSNIVVRIAKWSDLVCVFQMWQTSSASDSMLSKKKNSKNLSHSDVTHIYAVSYKFISY
jgi:hypothetical protein